MSISKIRTKMGISVNIPHSTRITMCIYVYA